MKRTPKTKEQILTDYRSGEDFKAKMAFTKNVFYPALIDASRSIDDTLSFLGSINTVLMESFLESMKKVTFGELKLIDKLDAKDEKFEEISTLLHLFDDKSVYDAKDLLEGMRREIQFFLNEETKQRSLEDLKPKWLDEL